MDAPPDTLTPEQLARKWADRLWNMRLDTSLPEGSRAIMAQVFEQAMSEARQEALSEAAKIVNRQISTYPTSDLEGAMRNNQLADIAQAVRALGGQQGGE